MTRGLTLLVFELVLISAGVFIGSAIYLDVNFIPRFVMHYQSAYFSDAEVWLIWKIFVGTHFVVLGLPKLARSWSGFDTPESFARTVYLLGIGASLTSLIVFVTIDVFFDPNFFAATFVATFVLFLVAFFVVHLSRARRARYSAGFRALGRFAVSLFRQLISVVGIAAILFAAATLVTALQFKRDKAFANSINNIRAFFTTSELHWSFVDAYPGEQFNQPIEVRFRPDTGEAYVLERSGRLFAMGIGGRRQKSSVLEFSNRVGEVEVENGALGFDFHPEFGQASSRSRGFVYVYYTDVRDGEQTNRLSRFDLSVDGMKERLESESVLVEFTRPSSGFHNGGKVVFGPDGFLYFGIGDVQDPQSYQKISRRLAGGIFRIDVDERESRSKPIGRQPFEGTTRGYRIPRDNPFVDVADGLGEFWALGLRNPFRFSFDSRTGELWVGDVGAARVEEVNRIRKGGNYQFPYFEGFIENKAPPTPLIGKDSGPYFAYHHTAFERAIIGGFVYRASLHQDLTDAYVFADNGSGYLYSLTIDDETEPTRTELARLNQQGYVGISSVIESPDGEILVTTLGSKNEPTGRVVRLVEDADMSEAVPGPQLPSSKDYTLDAIAGFYANNCARCHSADGSGDAKLSEQLGVVLPDFTDPDWQSARTDQTLYEVIARGGGAVGMNVAMPAFSNQLDERELTLMIEYIRSLSRQ